jgi:hypothetical protein
MAIWSDIEKAIFEWQNIGSPARGRDRLISVAA